MGRQAPGIIARADPNSQKTFPTGWNHAFDEKTLRLTLAEIAGRSYGAGATVNEALEEGSKQGMAHTMADGILTQREETLLREFRDRLAMDSAGIDRKAG